MTKFVAEVQVSIEVDEADLPEGEDAQFQMAYEAIDVLMRRAWDTDRGRHHVNRNWSFQLLEDAISIEDSVDVTDPEAWGVRPTA